MAGDTTLHVSSLWTKWAGCSDFDGVFKSRRLLNISLGRIYVVGKYTVLADEYSLPMMRKTA